VVASGTKLSLREGQMDEEVLEEMVRRGSVYGLQEGQMWDWPLDKTKAAVWIASFGFRRKSGLVSAPI
jgi:hypothetical protein